MKISDIITETTAAGAVATVAMPMGKMHKRNPSVFPKKKKKATERKFSKAEIIDEGLTYIGNCTQDETVDNIFGDVSEFARQVEMNGDEFEIDNLVVKYDPEEDIHHFYMKENFAEGKSPHKKGTKKYKKHMAAMHAGMGK